MKVIKRADTSAWKFKFTCCSCDSELEAESKDLSYRYVEGGDSRDPYPASEEYSVHCCVCSTRRIVPEAGLTKAVKHEAKERSQRHSTSYWDR